MTEDAGRTISGTDVVLAMRIMRESFTEQHFFNPVAVAYRLPTLTAPMQDRVRVRALRSIANVNVKWEPYGRLGAALRNSMLFHTVQAMKSLDKGLRRIRRAARLQGWTAGLRGWVVRRPREKPNRASRAQHDRINRRRRARHFSVIGA